jgi:hypothetical protein
MDSDMIVRLCWKVQVVLQVALCRLQNTADVLKDRSASIVRAKQSKQNSAWTARSPKIRLGRFTLYLRPMFSRILRQEECFVDCLPRRSMYYDAYKLRVHKFSKNLRAISKFSAPERWHWCKFHTEDPQILGATIQDLVAGATSRPGCQ